MALPEALAALPDATALAEFDSSAITGGKFHLNEWTINVDAAKAANLTISSKLLRAADLVTASK